MSRLPEVLTVYAPADPVSVLKNIKPSWAAVDVSDSGSLPWLEPLVSYAADTHTPMVCWDRIHLVTLWRFSPSTVASSNGRSRMAKA